MQIFETPKAAQADNIAIVRDILERAQDAGDPMFIDACNRLIEADARGEPVESLPNDWGLVEEMHASLEEDGVL
jgi:hypothetical protein